MTREEAIRILDPETTAEALAEIEYYAGFSGQRAKVQACNEACVVAVAAMRELAALESRLKIVEINPAFRQAVEANDGYCPCMMERTPETKCMCQDFRDQNEPGPCHCGRFKKVVE